MTDLTATPLRAPGRGGRSITILVAADVINGFADDPQITRVLVNDFVARDKYGYDKYGQNLECHDGRPTVWDLYQELLDGCQYNRKGIEEDSLPPGMEEVYPALLELTRITRKAIVAMEEKKNETENTGNAVMRPNDPEVNRCKAPQGKQLRRDHDGPVWADAGWSDRHNTRERVLHKGLHKG